MALPLGFGLWSVTGEASWAEDAAIVRDLGLLPAGSEGALSTVLAQLSTLLPLGGRSLRASLVGVFALTLASRWLFELVLALLERRARSPINPLLALFASATWALGAGVLPAAVRVGGPMPALALVLLGVMLARPAFERADVRALAATGLVLAAAAAESRAAGVILVLMVAGLAVVERRRGWQRDVWRVFAGLAGGLLLFGSLRAVGLSGAAELAPAGEALARGSELLASARLLPERWAWQLGSAPLLLALAGAVLGALHAPSRRQLWPWAFAALLGVLVPAAGEPLALGGLLGALSSLGVAVFFPLGVQALVCSLWASPLPFGRPAAVLAVTFATTLVLSRADRGRVEQTPGAGPSAWTDAALMRLPPRSFVLLHDERLTLRLLAARVLHGARPDVALLPTGRLSARALRVDPDLADPSLLSVLRQLWVNGNVDEYTLSALADDRPVFVEPEPAWEQRLLGHLAPDGIWLRFAPHGLGRSDRRAGTVRSRMVLRRALELAGGDAGLDAATRRALADAASGQAIVLGALRERELSGRMAHAARVIERGDQVARLEPGAPRARVAARDVSR